MGVTNFKTVMGLRNFLTNVMDQSEKRKKTKRNGERIQIRNEKCMA